MNLAVIGSGGREHAICYKLKQSPKIKKLICIPGNAGTQKIAENIKEDISNFKAIYQIIKGQHIDIVVVGPEQPLVEGLVDYLNEKKVRVFGPDKFASQLEGSKAFMKNLCKKNNIPTANFETFTNIDKASSFIKKVGFPIVVKADGLAAGKGVSICKSEEEALKNTKEILEGKFKSSNRVVLEEFLEGEELSYFTIVDENSYLFFGSAQDHKRVGEGDTGPNTGGMGAYSPTPLSTPEIISKTESRIIAPTLKAMKDKGHPYKGFLYVGIMIVDEEPYVIEFNVRMGDPETQVVIPLLDSSLYHLLDSSLDTKLSDINLKISSKTAVTVVLAAEGYPESYNKGMKIDGLDQIDKELVFHAGTKLIEGEIVTSGGRVLNVIGFGENLQSAIEEAYKISDKINFNDKFLRRDIGQKGLSYK